MGEKLTRRGFFGLLGGAAVTAIIAPKIYVFAPKGGWGFRPNLSDAEAWALENPLAGLHYWQTHVYTGNWTGLERSAYPGKLQLVPSPEQSEALKKWIGMPVHGGKARMGKLHGADLGVGYGPSFDGKLIATDRMRRRSVWEVRS